ncbi:Na(+)/H(+) antiporter subunit C [Trueperella sp. LYQ143]|uniref:Na(+)/H(+) antiporter subunit C n=1 Tax=unclassified Trueperella TaxID=2630174 RepID=UPI003983C670
MASLALAILAGGLVAVGVYLVLERSLSRIVLGLSAITNGVNIVFLIAGGRSGQPPIVGTAEPEHMSDPLAQAMMLTAIVISLSLTGFLLAMAYRMWQLNGNDEVQDDLEDRRIAQRAERDKIEARVDVPDTIEQQAAEASDEMEKGDPLEVAS